MIYLLKFAGAFCLLYFGTILIIGLSTPDNYYSSFVAHYLNFIDPLRNSLLKGSKALLSIFGYRSYLTNQFTLSLQSGEAVRMVYTCIGYGVLSFWGAFVFANKGRWQKKLKWILGGWAALWFVNVVRVSVLLISSEKNWSVPFGWDHHTWFNIAAYMLIFFMIYLYDLNYSKNRAGEKQERFQRVQNEQVQI